MACVATRADILAVERMVVILLVGPLATADLLDSIAISSAARPTRLVRALEAEIICAAALAFSFIF